MSEEWQDSRRASADDLQKAFEEAASGLDLELEPAGGGAPRCIGVAFMVAATIPFDIDDKALPVEDHDDKEIERLLLGHESLTPQQYKNGRWRDYLSPAHMVVTRQGLIQADQEVINQWLGSKQFLDFQKQYPWKQKRGVEVRNVMVTYLGVQLAVATYRVVETLANGKVIGGNSATLLARLQNVGWRGVVITKGERQEL